MAPDSLEMGMGRRFLLVCAWGFLMVGKAGTIFQEMSGIGCWYNLSKDSCSSYFLFTIPSLRVVCFSSGALCCSAFAKQSD